MFNTKQKRTDGQTRGSGVKETQEYSGTNQRKGGRQEITKPGSIQVYWKNHSFSQEKTSCFIWTYVKDETICAD